jgi:putative DNA primase/helicase
MNPPTIVVDELMKFDEAKHRRARCDAARKVTALRHSDVFQEILEALMPVDFREEAGIDGDKPVPQKALIVITVREVLKTAVELGCGLCRDHDFLYSYNGAYWKLIDRQELSDFLGEAAFKLGVDTITASYHRFRDHLHKQFLAVAKLPKPEADESACLINLLNGTFEITPTKLQLRAFRRVDFLTHQLPFEYDENATAPLWQKFLNEVLPDESRQLVLAEYIGYVFTRLKLEKTLMLYGTGANGKSVVFDVINALLGPENVVNHSLASLSHEYHRAKLANKLLNYSSDISTRLEADVFKRLTSGEPVDARLPYGEPFIMKKYARLLFNCNELPRDVEHTDAFFRRFLILLFDVTIPLARQDKRLAEKIIQSELSGVFNWMLSGLQRLLKQSNFSPCEAAREAVETYRKESDSVAMFLEEMGYEKVSDQSETTPLKEMFGEYRTFCQDNGFRSVSSSTLRKRLEGLGFDCPKINKGRIVYANRPW